jgi:hypothetical protein
MAMSTRVLSMGKYREHLIDLMKRRLLAVSAGDFDFNIPTMIWGGIGIGKSMIPQSVCQDTWVNAKDKKGNPLFDKEKLNALRPWDSSRWNTYSKEQKDELDSKNPEGWILMDVRLSMCEPSEIKGLPYYDMKNDKASFLRFASILPDNKSTHPTFLFLDELPLAPDMLLNAAYQLINDRKAADYRLPEKCVAMGAGNRAEDGGTFFEMSPALENRFDHIELDVDYNGFVKYLADDHGYDDTVVAFLQYEKEANKDVLYHVKDQSGKGNYPTFRSWEKALKKIKYGSKEYEAIADSVGQAVAQKFETFKDFTKNIPDASVLVKKKLYYEDVQLQLVAAQKVGNLLLSSELRKKLTGADAWNTFSYFLDMTNPEDKSNKREELTVLFLVNIKDHLEILEIVNDGMGQAIKKGDWKPYKNEDGELVGDAFTLVFDKWKSLGDLS